MPKEPKRTKKTRKEPQRTQKTRKEPENKSSIPRRTEKTRKDPGRNCFIPKKIKKTEKNLKNPKRNKEPKRTENIRKYRYYFIVYICCLLAAVLPRLMLRPDGIGCSVHALGLRARQSTGRSKAVSL